MTSSNYRAEMTVLYVRHLAGSGLEQGPGTPHRFLWQARRKTPHRRRKLHSRAAFALKPMLASAKPRRQGCKVLVGSGKQARKEGDRGLQEPVTLTSSPYQQTGWIDIPLDPVCYQECFLPLKRNDAIAAPK
jgi:hypothetical protein